MAEEVPGPLAEDDQTPAEANSWDSGRWYSRVFLSLSSKSCYVLNLFLIIFEFVLDACVVAY